MRKTIALLIALSLAVAACGSSDDNGDDDTDTTTSTAQESPDTTEAPTTEAPTTTAAATTPPETAPATSAASGGDAATSPVAVALSEWVVDAPETIAAGTVDFEIVNDGDFSHEFAVARGDSYETLPLLENGAVDEDLLADDLLGKTDLVDPGGDDIASFDLEPGNYVLFCNVQIGPNSHAAQGQSLGVTVVG